MKLTLHCLSFCGLIAAAHGSTILVDLDFDSLPSAQGFTYRPFGSNSTAVESTVFATNGTSLIQTTSGEYFGFSGGSITYFRNYAQNEFPELVNYHFDLRAQVTELEADLTPSSNSYLSFRQSIFFNGAGFTLGITPTELRLDGGLVPLIGFDGTVEHDYRVEVGLSGLNYRYELFVDNVSVLQSGPIVRGLVANQISFGDGTSAANSNGVRSNFVVTMNVPEPSSAWLLMLSGGLLLRRNRRV